MELFGLEVDIRAICQKDIDALDSLLLRVWRLASNTLSAEVALEAHEVEGRATIVVAFVRVNFVAIILPSVEDPLEASRVTMHCRLVDRQISILVVSSEDLVFLIFGPRLCQNLVKHFRLAVSTLAYDTHEGKLVLAHSLNSSAAATSHFSWYFTQASDLIIITVRVKI